MKILKKLSSSFFSVISSEARNLVFKLKNNLPCFFQSSILPIFQSSKKAIALAVVVCFFMSSVCRDAVAVAAMPTMDATQYKQIFTDFILPYSYGKITKSHFAGTDRVIINIQDLHCHPQVQKNISNIIEMFDKKYGVTNVYLEGAYGDVSTKWLTENIKNDKKKTEILNKILETGKLTGAEYYSAASDKTEIIKGLEKKGPYLDNLKRFGDLLEKQDEIQIILKGIEESTAKVKKQYYTKRQYKIEELSKEYVSGSMRPEKYYRLLAKHTEKLGIDLTKYENTYTYIKLLALQKQLDYKAITSQLQALVMILKEKLPYNAYKMLLDNTKNFEQTDKLYAYIIKISKDFGLDLTVNFKELNKYFTYIELSQKINPLELLKEEERLTREINTRFSDTVAQREVVFLTHFEKYLKDYMSTKITSDDYEYYKENIETYKRLYNKYVDNKVFSLLKPYMEEVDTFYKINNDRNDYFTENIFDGVETYEIENIKEEPKETNKIIENMDKVTRLDVIVTGGFHSQTVTEILQNQGVSYIVITPNVQGGVKEAEKTYYEIAKEQKEINFQTLATLVFCKMYGIDGENNRLPFLIKSMQLAKLTKEDVLSFPAVGNKNRLLVDEIWEMGDKEFNEKYGDNAISNLSEILEETKQKVDFAMNIESDDPDIEQFKSFIKDLGDALGINTENISDDDLRDLLVDIVNNKLNPLPFISFFFKKESNEIKQIKQIKQTIIEMIENGASLYTLMEFFAEAKSKNGKIMFESNDAISEYNGLHYIAGDGITTFESFLNRQRQQEQIFTVKKLLIEYEGISDRVDEIWKVANVILKEKPDIVDILIEFEEGKIDKDQDLIDILKKGESDENKEFENAYHKAFENFLNAIKSDKNESLDELIDNIFADPEKAMELAINYHNSSYFNAQKAAVYSGKNLENIDMRMLFPSYTGTDKVIIDEDGIARAYNYYLKGIIKDNEKIKQFLKDERGWTENKINNIANLGDKELAALRTELLLSFFNKDAKERLNDRTNDADFGRKVNLEDFNDLNPDNLRIFFMLIGKNGIAGTLDDNGYYELDDGSKVSELEEGKKYKIEESVLEEDIEALLEKGKGTRIGNANLMRGEDARDIIEEEWKDNETMKEKVRDGFINNQKNGIKSVFVVVFDLLRNPDKYYLRDKNGNILYDNDGKERFNVLLILLCIHSAWSLDNSWNTDLAHLPFPVNLLEDYEGKLTRVETIKDGDQFKVIYSVTTTGTTLSGSLEKIADILDDLGLFSGENKNIIKRMQKEHEAYQAAVNNILVGKSTEKDVNIVKQQSLEYPIRMNKIEYFKEKINNSATDIDALAEEIYEDNSIILKDKKDLLNKILSSNIVVNKQKIESLLEKVENLEQQVEQTEETEAEQTEENILPEQISGETQKTIQEQLREQETEEDSLRPQGFIGGDSAIYKSFMGIVKGQGKQILFEEAFRYVPLISIGIMMPILGAVFSPILVVAFSAFLFTATQIAFIEEHINFDAKLARLGRKNIYGFNGLTPITVGLSAIYIGLFAVSPLLLPVATVIAWVVHLAYNYGVKLNEIDGIQKGTHEERVFIENYGAEHLQELQDDKNGSNGISGTIRNLLRSIAGSRPQGLFGSFFKFKKEKAKKQEKVEKIKSVQEQNNEEYREGLNDDWKDLDFENLNLENEEVLNNFIESEKERLKEYKSRDDKFKKDVAERYVRYYIYISDEDFRKIVDDALGFGFHYYIQSVTSQVFKEITNKDMTEFGYEYLLTVHFNKGSVNDRKEQFNKFKNLFNDKYNQDLEVDFKSIVDLCKEKSEKEYEEINFKENSEEKYKEFKELEGFGFLSNDQQKMFAETFYEIFEEREKILKNKSNELEEIIYKIVSGEKIDNIEEEFNKLSKNRQLTMTWLDKFLSGIGLGIKEGDDNKILAKFFKWLLGGEQKRINLRNNAINKIENPIMVLSLAFPGIGLWFANRHDTEKEIVYSQMAFVLGTMPMMPTGSIIKRLFEGLKKLPEVRKNYKDKKVELADRHIFINSLSDAMDLKMAFLSGFIAGQFNDETISELKNSKLIFLNARDGYSQENIDALNKELEEERAVLYEIDGNAQYRGGLLIGEIEGKQIRLIYDRNNEKFVIYSKSGLSEGKDGDIININNQLKADGMDETLNEQNVKLPIFRNELVTSVFVGKEEIGEITEEKIGTVATDLTERVKVKSVTSVKIANTNVITDKSKSYSGLSDEQFIRNIENEVEEGDIVEVTIERINSLKSKKDLLKRLNKYEVEVVIKDKNEINEVQNLFEEYNTKLDTEFHFNGIKYQGEVNQSIIKELSEIATNGNNVRETKIILEPTQETISDKLVVDNEDCIWQLNLAQAEKNKDALESAKFRLTVDKEITDKQLKGWAAKIAGFVVENSEQKETLKDLLSKALGMLKNFVSLPALISAFDQLNNKARSMEAKVMNSEEDFGKITLTSQNAEMLYKEIFEKSAEDFKVNEERTKEQIEKELRKCEVFSGEANNFIESLIKEGRYEEAYGAIKGFSQIAVENVVLDKLAKNSIDEKEAKEKMRKDFRLNKNETVRKIFLTKGFMALALGEEIEYVIDNVEFEDGIPAEQVIAKGIKILNEKGQKELAEWEDKLPPLNEIKEQKKTILDEFRALFPVIEDRLQRVEVGKGSIGDIAVRGYKAMTAAA